MKYSEAKQGRVFVIRLEDGEILHESIERFATDHRIVAAAVILLGGADAGSRLVVGPREDRAHPIVPTDITLTSMHEITGTGTVFPDANGQPILHAHISCGRRDEETKTGCIRRGIRALTAPLQRVNRLGPRRPHPRQKNERTARVVVCSASSRHRIPITMARNARGRHR